MSLLDGNDTVLVQRMATLPDADGNPSLQPDGDPVPVRARVQALSATESASRGLETTTAYKVISRSWPGDERSRVLWRGRTWDTLAEPVRYVGGVLTPHVTTTIQTAEPYREV